MNLRVTKRAANAVKAVAMGVLRYEGEGAVHGPLAPQIKEALEVGDFLGRPTDTTVLSASGSPARRLVLIGLGKKEKVNGRTWRKAGARLTSAARTNGYSDLAIEANGLPDEAIQDIAEGLLLGNYEFTAFKSDDQKKPVKSATFCGVSKDAEINRTLSDVTVTGRWISAARDWGNRPANLLTPRAFAEDIRRRARSLQVRCAVYGRKELEKAGFGGVLGVAKGSAQEPQVIVLEYTPPRAKEHVALVGKALTFDSGGISLKAAQGMEDMKFDMCGGACAAASTLAAAELRLPVRVTAVIGATENMPGGNATRPGDVLKMYNGKTVEVLNTDAEGRLVLADCLAYVEKKHRPDCILDFATLTGACVVALGDACCGLFSNDDSLMARIESASTRAGERVWRMPYFEDYSKMMESDIAHLKNISGTTKAGACTAAAFLRSFVDSTPWAHFDIAGTAWADKSELNPVKGASGFGVRLVTEFLRSP